MSQFKDLHKASKTQVLHTYGRNHKDDLQMTEVRRVELMLYDKVSCRGERDLPRQKV